jgi:DnaK suppressor protein
MNSEQLLILKNKMQAERDEIIELSCSEEIDLQGDQEDKIQGNLIISMSSLFSKRNQDRINQIEDALYKIRLGTYGICYECEEEIPFRRLEIKPYVQCCVKCAEQIEKNR